MNNKFSQKLYELRKEKKMKQSDLGKAIGVSTRSISHYESGERECDFDTLIKICKFFGVSSDFMLGISDY